MEPQAGRLGSHRRKKARAGVHTARASPAEAPAYSYVKLNSAVPPEIPTAFTTEMAAVVPT